MEHRFTIKHTHSSDEAFADDEGGALCAAHALARDCTEATGRPLLVSRVDIVILDREIYRGDLTYKANRGERS